MVLVWSTLLLSVLSLEYVCLVKRGTCSCERLQNETENALLTATRGA